MSTKIEKAGPIPGEIRVRFAPSPTGSLHVGGARTHLFCWLFAKHHKGTLVLRIEDTDQERSTKASEDMVLKDIHSLALLPDESPQLGGNYGPYRQSERKEIYAKVAQQLLDEDKAFRCFCKEEDLNRKAEAAKAANKSTHYDGICRSISKEESDARVQNGESFTIRMKAPDRDFSFQDEIRGEISFDRGMIGDFIIIRSNSLPVYNFAVVVDDYLMRMSHLFRADEHLSNTHRQLILLDALSWEAPKYAHFSLVHGTDHKKLSKRHGAASVDDYLQKGYLPEALINFLALLGWTHPEEKEILSLEEIVTHFDISKLTKSPAVFDTEKLKWMNAEYIRKMELKELCEKVKPFAETAGFNTQLKDSNWFEAVIASLQERLVLLSDIGNHLKIYYPDHFAFETDAQEMLQSENAKTVMEQFEKEVNSFEGELTQLMKETPKTIKKATGIKGKDLFMPIRAAITGSLQGPDLQQVLPLIGKEELLRRIKLALAL